MTLFAFSYVVAGSLIHVRVPGKLCSISGAVLFQRDDVKWGNKFAFRLVLRVVLIFTTFAFLAIFTIFGIGLWLIFCCRVTFEQEAS